MSTFLKIKTILIIFAGCFSFISCKKNDDPQKPDPPEPIIELEMGSYSAVNSYPGVYPPDVRFIDKENLSMTNTMYEMSSFYKYVIIKDSIKTTEYPGNRTSTHYFHIIHSKKFEMGAPPFPPFPELLFTYEKIINSN